MIAPFFKVFDRFFFGLVDTEYVFERDEESAFAVLIVHLVFQFQEFYGEYVSPEKNIKRIESNADLFEKLYDIGVRDIV
jgi:hypothetical protein